MKRVVTPELLDDDLGTLEEIRDSLLDLRWFNEKFGGFQSMAEMLRTIAKQTRKDSLTFLDVAGGRGDVADSVICELLVDCIKISATVLDRAVSHLSWCGMGFSRVAADALALPFADGSFDVVGCNLFLHHLEPKDVLSFFSEALRVARVAVIASDLRRNLFHWLLASAGRFTYRSRITRNDAPASVRRAYTMTEMTALADQTPAASYEMERFFFQRFGLILWKAQL
jgi:ubiquinone/menaquinone biosynthesis C-methylase UbiE